MLENKTQDNFFIPKVIKVGYDNREDTYTKKLAYVIYYDHTNTLRKEKSWNNWRNKDIEPNEFENVPTEGFVLNKYVGGCKSYWNVRQSYCRIFDPRGFEFEITMNNLFWILEYEDCFHGKGLSGKFVYGWDKDQLVLIPVKTDDYTLSKNISDKMYVKQDKDILIPGALYKINLGQLYDVSDELVFIGNLKMQQKMGKSYKSCLFFYDINKHEEVYYENNKYKRKETVYSHLIRIDKKNIKALIKEDVLSYNEISEIIHRFELSAYSYSFWHTNNIIEKFTDNINEYESYFKYSKWYINSKLYKNQLIFGKIINDTTVSLIKYQQTQVEHDNINYGISYSFKFKPYKFITLDNNLNVNKICDLGKIKNFYGLDIYYYSIHYKLSLEQIHPEKSKYNENNIPYVKDEKELTPIYYITKDGYISDSLTQLIYTDSLSFVSDINLGENRFIQLPTKIK